MAKTIKTWVRGNTLHLVVPLQMVTVSDGVKTTTDYYPPQGSEVIVKMRSQFTAYSYDCVVDGNRVKITDDGSLPNGLFGVEVTVREPEGRNLRTFKCGQIKVVNCTDELGELPDGEVVLDAAVFIQGEKGDKGDKMAYDDLTAEEIAELQRPATEAAAVLAKEVRELEQTFSANEIKREQTFATYKPTLDGYDARLGALEITREQFNDIFND